MDAQRAAQALAAATAAMRPAWAVAALALAGVVRGGYELVRGRPRLAALALIAAAVTAIAGQALTCVLALTVAAVSPYARPRTDGPAVGLAATALGAAALIWALAGLEAAARAVVLGCAAAAWLETVAAAEARTARALVRRGIAWDGRQALAVAAGIDGIAVSPGAARPASDLRPRVLASARDREPALAAAADLLAAGGEPVGAAVAAAAARLGLAHRPVTWLRRLGAGEVIGSWDGCVVHVGPHERLAQLGIAVPWHLRRAARSAAATLGVAWGGRCRCLLVLPDREAAGLRRLHAMGCEVWTGDGRVIALRYRRYEPVFAIASMIARGRRVAAVAAAGGPVPVADLALIVSPGSAVPVPESPWVSLPAGGLDEIAALLATCRRLRRLRIAGWALAATLCGPGLLLAALGEVPRPFPDGTLAVAAAALLVLAAARLVDFFTSSQRRYA